MGRCEALQTCKGDTVFKITYSTPTGTLTFLERGRRAAKSRVRYALRCAANACVFAAVMVKDPNGLVIGRWVEGRWL